MICTFDLNVLLDFFARREPFFEDSAWVVNWVFEKKVQGVCPAHCLTTLYYLTRRSSGRDKAESAVDFVLKHFRVPALDDADWANARRSSIDDFEDAVVDQAAIRTRSTYIISRDPDDFKFSQVPVISPAEFIRTFALRFDDLA